MYEIPIRRFDPGRLRAIAALVAENTPIRRFGTDSVRYGAMERAPRAQERSTLGTTPSRRTMWWSMTVLIAIGLGLGLLASNQDFVLRSRLRAKSADHAAKEAAYREMERYASWRAMVFEKDGRSKQEIAAFESGFHANSKAGSPSPFGDYFHYPHEVRRQSAATSSKLAKQFANQAAYHARLKSKYERATEDPSRPIEPDPPPPD